jgi:serine/threonine protein kinase
MRNWEERSEALPPSAAARIEDTREWRSNHHFSGLLGGATVAASVSFPVLSCKASIGSVRIVRTRTYGAFAWEPAGTLMKSWRRSARVAWDRCIARDPRVGREVALKISAEQFSERFEREARAIAALNHPNICQLYDVGPNYLVMESVEGRRWRSVSNPGEFRWRKLSKSHARSWMLWRPRTRKGSFTAI